ncbi:RNase A-like domain-containing protein [Kitasatospora sp. NPDC101235]|uniref:RNase A-like domain-containing protein n=1 Tax=Kitasatospora sp. NPDC101235 TaxID=3364101 RepID=UPI0037FA1DF3
MADEGTSEAHTLSHHVNISGQRLIDKVTKDGVASVWADQQTAVRASQKAFDQWYANGTNAQKLAEWITKQERRGKNAPFNPARDTKSFTWTVRDEGSLGPFSCSAAVPKILLKGYTLIVWYKDEFGVLAKNPIPLVGKAAAPIG